MTKLKVIIKNTIFQISVITLLLIILYGIGRFFHIVPPVKAIIQLVKVNKIKNIYGEKSIEYSSALDSLADIYYKKGFRKWGTNNREKALKCFAEGNHQNSVEYALSLFKFSQYLLNHGNENFEKTALLCKDCFLRLGQTTQLNDDLKRKFVSILLLTYSFENDLNKKVKLIQLAQKLNDSIGDQSDEEHLNRIRLYTVQGLNYTEVYTSWIEAQNSFEKALDLSTDKKYKVDNTYAKILFARLLNKMQNFSRSKSLLDSCPQDIIRNEIDLILYKKQLADALNGLGLISDAQKQIDDVEKLNFEKMPGIQFSIYFNKTINKIMSGNILLSYYYLRRIKWILRNSEIKDDLHLYHYYYLESLYCRRFNRSQLDFWTEKLEKIKDRDKEDDIHLLFAETIVERLLKNETYFGKASELYVNLQKNVIAHFKYLTEVQRMNYWHQYEIAIPMLYEAGFLAQQQPDINKLCYNAALFSKGILLGSSIEFNKLLSESADSSLLHNYFQLLEIRQKLTSNIPGTIDSDSLTRLSEKIERTLVQKSQEFGDYTNKMNITWKDIQRNLKENDVAIEFIDFPTGEDSTIYSALIIRKNWEQPQMTTLFENKQLSSLINESPDKIYSTSIGIKISNLVWGKLLPFLNQNDNVFFSTTNLLHKVAIESLPINDSVRVNEVFHLNRVSSTKQLCYDLNNKRINSSVLYGGLKYSLDDDELIKESRNYLPNSRGGRYCSRSNVDWQYLPKTKEEVDSINRLLITNKIPTVLYEAEKGNEESFKNLSGKEYSIIHIATHGFFSTNEKAKEYKSQIENNNSFQTDSSLFRSGLILAGANKAWCGKLIPNEVEDGILTAQEVSTLNFRKTHMVLLSACKTGLGEITSEGVFGLQRAFKKAGVETIIMSLWDVDDNATSIFMTAFYRQLLNGSNKREAFLKAQQTVRSIKKYESPASWAAFIMLD